MRPKPALSETDLLHLFIAHVPYVLPDVRVFRRNILNVATIYGFRARNGTTGQADAYAITRGGRHVEIETKSARGDLEEEQLAWRAFCADFDIPHLVLRARRGETPEDTVHRWADELARIIRSHQKSIES